MENQFPDRTKIPEDNQQCHRYFENFPPGYRFKPTDMELVLYYLNPKLDGKDLPPNIIEDESLYKYTPDQLAESYNPRGRNGEEWYFFTSRARKYRNGERPNRKAGAGYWRATGKDKEIKVGEKDIVGFKKSLVFYKGDHRKGVKTNWIMHEFRANREKRVRLSPDDMQLDDWVLCRIYKKYLTDKKDDDEDDKQKDGDVADGPKTRKTISRTSKITTKKINIIKS